MACTEAGRHKRHPRMRAEPWKGTHLLSPFPPGLGVIGCSRLPAHSLPCASAALLASKPRDRAKSPPLPPCSLPRGAAGLAAGFPVPGTPRVGLAALGKPGSGTPPAVCYPAAVFQLAMLRPQTRAPNGFLAKAAGKTSEVWVFRLGVSHISLPKGFTFLSLFLHPSRAVCAVPSVFQLSLYLRMELLSPLECLFSLCDYFAFLYLLFAFQQHLKASGSMRDCFCWFCLPSLSTSRSGLSPAFSGMGKGSYKL